MPPTTAPPPLYMGVMSERGGHGSWPGGVEGDTEGEVDPEAAEGPRQQLHVPAEPKPSGGQAEPFLKLKYCKT